MMHDTSCCTIHRSTSSCIVFTWQALRLDKILLALSPWLFFAVFFWLGRPGKRQTFFFLPMHMNPVLWPNHRGEEGGLGMASGGGGGGGGAQSSSMLPHAGYHQAPAEHGGSAGGAATAASALISPSQGAFSCGSMAAMNPTAQATASTAATPAAASAYSRSQQFGGEWFRGFALPSTLFSVLPGIRYWSELLVNGEKRVVNACFITTI